MFAQSKGGNYSLTNGASGVADAIDFDGATDYLSRSSDLVGNADGKTFTFSAWVDTRTTGDGVLYGVEGGFFTFEIQTSGGLKRLVFAGSTTAGVTNLLAWTNYGEIPVNSFAHVLVSVDLSNSSNRRVFVNDVDITSSVTWNNYSNSDIDRTRVPLGVGGFVGVFKYPGRLSHVFLDYTYRDLSIEANRRLFITADRKPAANQVALNPILYLPLNDPTQPGKNLGTGGDFALNGVVARSGRGPSQFNAPYSGLDGTADYLSKTGPLLGAGSKTITFSCAFTPGSVTTTQYLFGFWTSVTTISQIFGIAIDTDGSLDILGQVSPGAGNYILNASSSAGLLKIGRNYTLQVSLDLSDAGKRYVYLNGALVNMTWTTYTNDFIFFNQASNSPITSAGRSRGFYFNGRLGNVFFDTRYIDLSQPANLAKFVTGAGIDAKPADLGANGEKPFGTPPLIYLPMYGNNAGKNYGTGGDFTVNSGPFTGARGPNEFWGNKADFNGTTGYLYRTSALAGVSDGKTFSGSFYVSVDIDASSRSIFAMSSGGSNDSGVQVYRNLANNIVIRAFDAVTNQLLTATTSSLVNVAGGTVHIAYCFDLSNTTKRFVYINGVLDASVTYANYTNANISFANTAVIRVGASAYSSPSDYLDGKLSEFYFTTEYIDFSQEANRLKFRDAFGNPVDLAPQIAAGTLPNPAIYMRFDPANFGKNSGTGGDFTVSGTITDGGQL